MPANGKYTIVSGDTFWEISKRLGVDVSVIQSLNPKVKPEALQVGQIIKVPSSSGPQTEAPPPALSSTHTIVSGDTFAAIAQGLGTNVAHIKYLNPGIRPESLQVGQSINIPSGPPPPYRHHHQHHHLPSPAPSIPGYTRLTGPSQAFPHPSTWATYAHLLTINTPLMLLNSSPSEVSHIKKWIPLIATSSGVDARVILCIIMQESGGNVRNPTTLSPAPDFVKNTGLMQAHNGMEWDERYPEWCVEWMIRDGAQGTKYGDGLIQCYHKWGRDWYHACRAYNSGRVNVQDLSDGITATGHYVERVANRLVGNQWAGM